MKKFVFLFLLLFAADILIVRSSDKDFREFASEPDSIYVLHPENIHSGEGQMISTLISRYHYKKFRFDDSMSSIVFDRFIKTMDNNRNFLLASDVRRFEEYRYSFDEEFRAGDFQHVYEMFNLFMQRFKERMDYTDKLLEHEFDFTLNEVYTIDRENAEFPESTEEANQIWRKRIKNEALSLKLTGKDWDSIAETLRKRYDTYKNNLLKYNSEDVFQLVMNSYTESVDPHTNYLSPITSENFKISMSQSLEGIGAQLQNQDDYTIIAEIIPGGPAFKSRLIDKNDKIVAVAQDEEGEWVDIVGWRVTDVVKLIRGPKGSTVRLQLLKAKDGPNSVPLTVTLVRDKIKLEDQSAKVETLEINSNGQSYKIGVIKLPAFYSDFEAAQRGEKDFKSTTRDVHKILDSLRSINIDGIVMDLRNNGGGSLTEAIQLTGLFIKYGPVVQVKDADGTVEVQEDPDPSIIYNGPLAVLVNRWSASASEIFAAAIQDYGRGIILGEQTYGKGTVQNLIDMNRLMHSYDKKYGQLKLTIAKYYRINGGSTQNLGVIPDIKYPSYFDDPQKYGESSEKSALQWDQIKPADYNLYSSLGKIIPELRKKHQQRIEQNLEFDYLMEDIIKFKKEHQLKAVSLNEEVRKKDKEKEEEEKFERENARRREKGLTLLKKGEVPQEEDTEEDVLLKESGFIIADLIQLQG